PADAPAARPRTRPPRRDGSGVDVDAVVRLLQLRLAVQRVRAAGDLAAGGERHRRAARGSTVRCRLRARGPAPAPVRAGRARGAVAGSRPGLRRLVTRAPGWPDPLPGGPTRGRIATARPRRQRRPPPSSSPVPRAATSRHT